MSRPTASISLDADNLWSYLKTHGNPDWQSRPGYLPALGPRLLDAYGRHGITASVFVVGHDAATDEGADFVASLTAAGHEIANHSFEHEPWLHLYSRDRLDDELARTEEAIVAAGAPRPIGFRGPGYSLSPSLLELLERRGYPYDATTLPTWIGPLARAYYFRSVQLSADERAQRQALFGSASRGTASGRPLPVAHRGVTGPRAHGAGRAAGDHDAAGQGTHPRQLRAPRPSGEPGTGPALPGRLAADVPADRGRAEHPAAPAGHPRRRRRAGAGVLPRHGPAGRREGQGARPRAGAADRRLRRGRHGRARTAGRGPALRVRDASDAGPHRYGAGRRREPAGTAPVITRVLHVSQPVTEGVARVLADLALFQRDNGWEVHVACPPSGWLGAELGGHGIAVHPWEATRSPGVSLDGRGTSAARGGAPDSAPTWCTCTAPRRGWPDGWRCAAQVATVFQPHAWSFHASGGAMARLSARWERLAVRWTDLMVAVSGGELHEGYRHGIEPRRSVVAPNGVDVNRFVPKDQAEARAELGLGDGPVAVCVGRLARQKGQDLLLRAWPEVVAEVPDAQLLLVGEGRDHDDLVTLLSRGARLVGGTSAPRRTTTRRPTWWWFRPGGRAWRWCRSRRWPASGAVVGFDVDRSGRERR